MIRRLLPGSFLFIAILLDATLVPMFFSAWFLPIISLTVINCTGLMLGKTRGVWYALAGGLLMDILVGMPFGMWTAAFTATGYLGGLIGRMFVRVRLAPVISGAACRLVVELMFLGYTLLASVRFEPGVLPHALARIALEAVLVPAMYGILNRIYKPSRSRFAAR